jgi:hypothetical protein
MPQHQHCPLAKRRGDRNPNKYHEEHQKDVAWIIAAHIPQTTPKRNKSSSTNEILHTDITINREVKRKEKKRKGAHQPC